MAMVIWELRLQGNPDLGRAGWASVTWQNRYALLFGGRVNDKLFLDVWSFDARVPNPMLTCLSQGHADAHGRAYHTATIVDSTVWILGGSTDVEIFGEAWTFRPDSREWRKVPLRGDTHLLKRSAHAACAHPTRPHCILIFGGYGMVDGTEEKPRWLSDLVVVDTKARLVERLAPNGPVPVPRGYHSLNAVGHLCIGLLGRSQQSKLVPVKDGVVVYDAFTNTWAILRVKGDVPTGRSSHRASAVPGGLLMFGGAPGSGKGHRFSEALLLKVNEATGEMVWRRCGGARSDVKGGGEAAQKEGGMPRGRAGHAQEWINGTLHVFGGYANQKIYCQDAWSAKLEVDEVPPSEESPLARAPAAPVKASKAAALAAAPAAAAPPAKPEPWRGDKRKRAAGAAAAGPPPKAQPDGGVGKRLRALAVTSPKAPLPAKDTPLKGAQPRTRLPPLLPGQLPSITPPEDVHSTSQREMPPPPPQQQVVVDMRELRRDWEGEVVQRRKMEALHYQEKKDWMTEREELRKEREEARKEREEARREAKSAKDELQIADRNWKEAGEKVKKLQGTLSIANARANSAEARSEQLMQLKDDAEAQAQANKEKWDRARLISTQLNKAVQEAEKERDRAIANVEGLERALKEEKNAAAAAAAARDTLQEQNAVLQQNVAAAEREKDQLAADLAAVRLQLTNIRRDLETERARVASETAEAKRALMAAEQQARETQQRLVDVELKLSQAIAERNRLQDKVTELETTRCELDRARRGAEQRESHLNNDLEKLQREMVALKSRVDQEKAAFETSLTVMLQQLRRGGSFGGGPSS